MLKLGEIDTSPWDDFPLSKFLLVALIVLIRTEECDVVPRLSASLNLLGLRWLNKALAPELWKYPSPFEEPSKIPKKWR